MAPTAGPGTPAKAPGTVKLWKSQDIAIAPTLPMDPKPPRASGRSYVLEFALGRPARMGKLFHTQVTGKIQSPLGSLVLCSRTC